MTRAIPYRVRCPYCGGLYLLRKDGTLRMHHPAVDPGTIRKCAGTGWKAPR